MTHISPWQRANKGVHSTLVAMLLLNWHGHVLNRYLNTLTKMENKVDQAQETNIKDEVA